jgi:hypothetical protein
MSNTNMGQPTDPLVMRESVRDGVSPGSGMFPDAGNGALFALLAVHLTIHLVRFTKQIFGAAVVASEDEALQDRAPRTVTGRLRVECFDGRIRTVQIVVIDLDELTEEIRLNGRTIGFICRAGPIFVAMTGTRLDRAEECGQCLLWDKAATILVTLMGGPPEPEKLGPLVGVPQRTTGDRDRDGDTGRALDRQLLRVHEMSRSGGPKW